MGLPILPVLYSWPVNCEATGQLSTGSWRLPGRAITPPSIWGLLKLPSGCSPSESRYKACRLYQQQRGVAQIRLSLSDLRGNGVGRLDKALVSLKCSPALLKSLLRPLLSLRTFDMISASAKLEVSRTINYTMIQQIKIENCLPYNYY